MSPQQVSLVRQSWKQVTPIAEQAAALFYARLLELDPELRHLFSGDMEEQGRKLMAMISTVVAKLDALDDLLPAVQQLGRRHVGYGVEEQHYETVGAALMWTLEKGLGDAFDRDTRAAWARAYALLADAMKEDATSAV